MTREGGFAETVVLIIVIIVIISIVIIGQVLEIG
jgi:hypothetical protein